VLSGTETAVRAVAVVLWLVKVLNGSQEITKKSKVMDKAKVAH
jgi:hypothetical protein